jgi:hypothetical protein
MYSTITNQIIEKWLQICENYDIDKNLIESIQQLANESQLDRADKLSQVIQSLEAKYANEAKVADS